MPAFGVYFQRMYPTLSPKPATTKEAFLTVRNMWGVLSEAEKEVRLAVLLHRRFRRGASEGLLDDRVPTLPIITSLALSTPSFPLSTHNRLHLSLIIRNS